jgi:hypothetical protein
VVFALLDLADAVERGRDNGAEEGEDPGHSEDALEAGVGHVFDQLDDDMHSSLLKGLTATYGAKPDVKKKAASVKRFRQGVLTEAHRLV